MTSNILVAVALVLVLEGIVPFLARRPRGVKLSVA